MILLQAFGSIGDFLGAGDASYNNRQLSPFRSHRYSRIMADHPPPPPPHDHGHDHPSSARCQLDPTVLNAKTLPEVSDLALSVFASLCGKNRGAFVLPEADGQTYGCLQLPTHLDELAGATHIPNDVMLDTANDIQTQYGGGNLTATDTLALLDYLVQVVYDSTPHPETNLYACETNGLTTLSCDNGPKPHHHGEGLVMEDGAPIRSVTLAGVMAPAPWVVTEPLSPSQVLEWYTADDFVQMKEVGLNAVQIPVPLHTFAGPDGPDHHHHHEGDQLELLHELVRMAEEADLKVILQLVSEGDDVHNEDAVVAAAQWASTQTVILALTLPATSHDKISSLIPVIRDDPTSADTLPLLVPVKEDDLVHLSGHPSFGPNIFASLSLSHTSTIADVASSSSAEDRSKLFYHEATSCMWRSPLEHATCFSSEHSMSVFVSSGFDLAIDDCAMASTMPEWKDYGQCDRFNETTTSNWWQTHRQSFAARQLFAYEHGLGWSFATWKLYPDEKDTSVLTDPAQLLALQSVVEAGLFPSLDKVPAAPLACLNPPEPDFVLGDDTLAPTAGPPPDCGNGWWNATTSQCDYWIPPPEPTAPPTEPCPICDNETSSFLSSKSNQAGGVGILIGVVLAMGATKLFGNGRRSEYQTIPN